MDDFKISIKAARVNAKKTQQEVARFLGLNRDTYRKYEHGELAFRMDMAVKFAEYVGTPIKFIDFYLPKNIA